MRQRVLVRADSKFWHCTIFPTPDRQDFTTFLTKYSEKVDFKKSFSNKKVIQQISVFDLFKIRFWFRH